MNKQLNSAIAHLKGKGYTVLQDTTGLRCEWNSIDYSGDMPTMKDCMEWFEEEQILALAKSAGWTGEEWEPKEGEYAWCAYLVPKAVTLERFYHVQNGFALRDSRIFPNTPAGLAQAKKKAGIEVEGL